MMQLASFRAPNFWLLALMTLCLTANSAIAVAAVSEVKIAVIYDVGGRGDKSLDDLTAAGVDLAKAKFGLTKFNLREIVTIGTEFDRENRLEFLVKSGYKMIIAVGTNFERAIGYIAQKYPESQFAIIGNSRVAALNVTAMDFANDQGSFLAGVLAAKSSKSGKVGYLGDSAELTNLVDQANFIAGAKYATPKITVYAQQADVGLNVETRALVNRGVDVIYSTWSRNGEVLSEVALLNSPKRSIKLIGVSPDQFFLNSLEGQKYIMAVVAKRFDVAAIDLIGSAIQDRTIMEEIAVSNLVYGRRYTLANGIELKIRSATDSAKLAISQARSLLISKRILSVK